MDIEKQLPPGMFLRKETGVYYVKKQINGRPLKQSTGKRDFKSALRRYHEIMKGWNDGASGWDALKTPTFAEYWEKHYRPAYTVNKTPRPGSKTLFSDDQLIVAPLADLGRLRLSDVTKTICQKWANRRRQMTYTRKVGGTEYPISESTVTREISFLQAIFQQAVEDGILEKNPWKKVEREGYAVKTRVLTLDEQEKLLAASTPKFQRFILFMLGTGLRLEEVRGINESVDVNFPERWVRVTRKTRGRKKKVQQVPLIDPFLLDILQEQLEDEEHLWHQNPQRLRQVLDEGAKRAGIDHLSPHTLRHTFATRYLQAGGDIYILSKLLGHASVSVTERVYAHLVGEDLLQRSRGVNLGLRPVRVLPFRPAAIA